MPRTLATPTPDDVEVPSEPLHQAFNYRREPPCTHYASLRVLRSYIEMGFGLTAHSTKG